MVRHLRCSPSVFFITRISRKCMIHTIIFKLSRQHDNIWSKSTKMQQSRYISHDIKWNLLYTWHFFTFRTCYIRNNPTKWPFPLINRCSPMTTNCCIKKIVVFTWVRSFILEIFFFLYPMQLNVFNWVFMRWILIIFDFKTKFQYDIQWNSLKIIRLVVKNRCKISI